MACQGFLSISFLDLGERNRRDPEVMWCGNCWWEQIIHFTSTHILLMWKLNSYSQYQLFWSRLPRPENQNLNKVIDGHIEIIAWVWHEGTGRRSVVCTFGDCVVWIESTPELILCFVSVWRVVNGALTTMAHNVLWIKPHKNPKPFSGPLPVCKINVAWVAASY